ncbi:energy-coupling factor transporter ATPase [Mesoplasma lactucae]|uniref:Energy-coupling factor transporter ATP-binding protein EcfA2 n=1 Tax=Mesoplasma lactucae ATCC 49193 TaxID=81460 RepID=A0A291IR26_9MOLU|nr:energy-coupling factor transporter ATPase [Mesoplasma lactucae]ATG97200.1 energy-coupling factor transporter ATPase [Mesoplasma lactucae ATCC 49193]ATZ20359.1 cobalt ABC transporter ATP-binding subunit [Mesoplasma lactucae ATCC 49193]MCL8216530.1 Energy-coupling factor transporter ATP-binding protein EcfA2 [Mesoplasma lactucae ATCC 49193]
MQNQVNKQQLRLAKKEAKLDDKKRKAFDKKNNKPYFEQLKEAKKTKSKFDYTKDIDLKDVSYTYSKGSPFEFKALNNANVTLKDGKITCIIGTTGSGKSTLIQLTNGLLISETGVSLIGNYPIPAGVKKLYDVKELRKEIGLVFQFAEYQLFEDTVEKDISFGPIHMGENKKEAVAQVPKLLTLVGLPTNYASRSPFELSGGQKRRVAIAGILAMNGNTLVLDEPTGGLDPQGEEDFMNLFLNLNKKYGKRIIMVTHNMDQVLKIADEVIVMHEGELFKKDTPFKIFSDKAVLEDMEIEPPKVYELIYALKDRGIDLTGKEIRTVDDFALEFKNYLDNKKKK